MNKMLTNLKCLNKTLINGTEKILFLGIRSWTNQYLLWPTRVWSTTTQAYKKSRHWATCTPTVRWWQSYSSSFSSAVEPSAALNRLTAGGMNNIWLKKESERQPNDSSLKNNIKNNVDENIIYCSHFWYNSCWKLSSLQQQGSTWW